MMAKFVILVLALAAVCSAGVIPAAVPAALTVGTYATSYNAHAINHAVAAPYIAAPAIATSPYIAAPAVAASPYVPASAFAASPFAPYTNYPALSAYSAFPGGPFY